MNIKHLNIARCSLITDLGLLNISEMNIKHLNIAYCGLITDQGLLNISSMSIKHIDITGLYITDVGLTYLSVFNNDNLIITNYSHRQVYR